MCAPGSLRDMYVAGRLGSYLCATTAHIDGHLRNLRVRLACDITPRQRAAALHDADALLDRRAVMTGL